MPSVKDCFRLALFTAVVTSLVAFGLASDAKLAVGAGGAAGPVKYALDPPPMHHLSPTTLPNDGLQLDLTFNDVPDGSFFIDLELSDGAWLAPAFGDITVTIQPWSGSVGAVYEGVPINANVLPPIYGGSSLLRLTWDWSARPITYLSKITVYLTSERFQDENPSILWRPGTIDLTVAIMEAEGSSFDPQLEDPETIPFAIGRIPFDDIEVDPTTALIDVASVNPINDRTRVFFETGLAGPTDNDLLLFDVGANIKLPACPTDLYEQNGDPWVLAEDDTVALIFTSDLPWGAEIAGLFLSPTPPFLDGGPLGLGTPAVIPAGDFARVIPWSPQEGAVHVPYCGNFDGNWQWITIAVSGAEPISERSFRVQFYFDGRRYLYHPLSSWSLNGSVLAAHWLQGNTTIGGGPFKSRIYLHNGDSYDAPVTVQLYELPIAQGAATPAADPLGPPIEVGTIEAGKGLLIRMEDVLAAAGITLPHIEGLGNIQAIVTLPAKNASGSYQVFQADGSAAFGLCPLYSLNNNMNQWLWDLLVQFPNVFPPGGLPPEEDANFTQK